jgi:hypothetical protein
MILFASTVLTHTLEVRPECTESKLWAHEKCPEGSLTFICLNYQSDGSEYFV